jgi:hypothetical protein
MSEVVTLELPSAVVEQARVVAARTHQTLEDVLSDWLDRFVSDLPVDSLTDEQVLALCDMQMDDNQQQELNELLAQQREGQLTELAREQLERLMNIYRRGLVQKAEALKVAVARGLHRPLS